MKKLSALLTLLCLCLLAGCSSGVTQEEYDSVVKENEELKKQVSSLQDDYESQSAELEDVTSKYNSLDAKREEYVNKELELATTKAWVASCFGDDSIYFVDNPKYLQCISAKTYTCTTDGIKGIWTDLLSTAMVLEELNKTDMQIDYEKIAMKYPDKNGDTIIEFTLEQEDGKYTFGSISCDATRSSTIAPILYALANLS